MLIGGGGGGGEPGARKCTQADTMLNPKSGKAGRLFGTDQPLPSLVLGV